MSEVIAPSHYYDFCGLAILQPLIEGCFSSMHQSAGGTNPLKWLELATSTVPLFKIDLFLSHCQDFLGMENTYTLGCKNYGSV